MGKFRINTAKGCTFVLMQSIFTNLFSGAYDVRSGLSKEGIHLTNNQVFSLLLIREFMGTNRKITVTRREIFEGIIKKSLGVSYSTFNRAFNALVKRRCLLPVGAKDKAGWLGTPEQYRLSILSKRVDSLLLKIA